MTALLDNYRQAMRALLPPGRLFAQRPDSLLEALLAALAQQFAAVHARADQLLVELHPPSTIELISDYETMLGLPDPCAPPAQTLEERRARVMQRLTVQPRPTVAYLKDLCTLLGYPDADITESGPYELTASVPNPRVVLARAGSARCGDRLTTIRRAEDLECLLREERPAHLSVVFSYTGV